MALSIVIAPDPVLATVCAPVGDPASMGALAWDMLRAMYVAEGRGLAAPQVGVAQRLFVVDVTWKAGAPAPQVFVNPRVIEASPHLATHEERCLSIPDRPVRVARPAWVVLGWQGLDGVAHQARFDGAAGVCVQHELDHLDGVLITDKAAA